MRIHVHEMYYPDDEGPDESELSRQIEDDVSKALKANVEAFRSTVLDKCPQATVGTGELEIKGIEYNAGHWGPSLTATVRCPVSVTLPADDESLKDAIDEAVASLVPVADKRGRLQGLEWVADWDDESALAYALEGAYKKEG